MLQSGIFKSLICLLKLFVYLIVLFDSLWPSQQFFSYVGMGLPGLNQY